MENQTVLDTLNTVQQTCDYISHTSNGTSLDIIYKISMIFIAAFNLVFAISIFITKNRKEDNSNEKNRKIGLLKTLVFDYNMSHFYNFFDCIYEETRKLKQPNLLVEDKIIINNNLITCGKLLRQKFIDTLIAIDKKIYDSIIESTDKLLDNFTESIFDDGINLSHEPKFEEIITKEIFKTKTDIIRQLFNYKGE